MSETVLVVTWRARDLLAETLESLRRQTRAHRVLVVDNASSDGTAEMLAERFPEVAVLRTDQNLGFAGGVDAGLALVDTELVALLNDDAVAEPGWLAALTAAAGEHPEAAAITSRLLLTDDGTGARLNNAGVVLLPDGYGADRGLGEPATAHPEPGEVFGFSGGAALLRVAAVRAVGGFPAPYFLYYEDTDTSWRLRQAGWTVRYEPAAVVHHRHSASSDQNSASFAYWNERNRLLMHVRCAPAGRAARVWLRFLLTTASLAARRLAGDGPPAGQQQRLLLRARVLVGAVRLLPWAVISRRRPAHLASIAPPVDSD